MECDKPSFSATGDGAGDVETRRKFRSPGNEECRNRRHFPLDCIDEFSHMLHAGERDVFWRAGDLGEDGKDVVLNVEENSFDLCFLCEKVVRTLSFAPADETI